MTLEERYKIQKKKNERLVEKLASLEVEKGLKEKGINGELESLRYLMTETENIYGELQTRLKQLREYEDEYKMLIGSLRELKEGLEEQFSQL